MTAHKGFCSDEGWWRVLEKGYIRQQCKNMVGVKGMGVIVIVFMVDAESP